MVRVILVQFSKNVSFGLYIIVIYCYGAHIIFRPFLTRAKREILADYAMPVAVIAMSCTGAYCFQDIRGKRHILKYVAHITHTAAVCNIQLAGSGI